MPNPVDYSVFHAEAMLPLRMTMTFSCGKPKGREQLLEEIAALCRIATAAFTCASKAAASLPLAARTTCARLAPAKWRSMPPSAKAPISTVRIVSPSISVPAVWSPSRKDLNSRNLYGQGTMLTFRDAGDLADRVENMLTDGSWREIARHGQTMAQQVSDCRIVAQYMMDRSFARQTFEWPQWTHEFYEKA